jgi:subtilase family serine protease
MTFRCIARSAIFAAALGSAHIALAAAPAAVTRPIDDHQTVTLAGNTRPEARLANDRGALPADFALDHMQLLLKRPAATEAALTRFIDSQYDSTSPNFHRWLTAAQLGETYGPAESDIAAVTTWLTAHGFTVNGIATSRMTIDFSGTAAAVNSAFHTELHRLDVAGASHIANMSDPRIPAALSGVVAGVTSLNDFRPHTNFRLRTQYTASLNGGTNYTVVPADLAKIYNFNPVFSAGYSGTGQTVVVIEDTNVYSTADWTKFRSEFGLSTYTSGSFKQVHPTGSASCTNPGVAGDEIEAILDAEWASAAAPSATIELASCNDTSTVFGGLIALQNLINGASPPAIVSISYGECEAENGATQNAAFYTTYQQAAGEGISVFVSSGDEGAASCDADLANATHGIGVSGFATTPYNVAVGGTDFGDTYTNKNSSYWGSANSSTYESAKSYIPEIPWNDSCASALIAYVNGYSESYGSSGFCNTSQGSPYLTTAGGSGGPSGCASGSPSVNGVVSGSCKGYAKPSWQTVLGNPADGVRDIPDVALFAADGVWNHFYIFCDSDPADATPCTGAPINWAGAGGTSFASPILAGIQALVNEHQREAQGNPNPVYYKLAAKEYGTTGDANCNASLGKSISSACIFNDVNTGSMVVNCTGSHSCYRPSGTYGVLSTSDSSYQKAYPAGTGWDFATGIGTLNVYNLLVKW